MKSLAAVLSLVLVLASSVWAEEFVEPSTSIRFPEAIALAAGEHVDSSCAPTSVALCRGAVRRYPDPKLGIGLSYTFAGNAVVASVFIYDNGEAGFPDGPDSPLVERQYDAMKGEIRSMEALGNYRNVRLVSEASGETAASIGPLKARVAQFSYERDGRAYLSDAYLSALKGKLLKVRVTYRADVRAAKAAVDVFMAELGARVAEALGARSAALDRTASMTDWRRS